MRKAMVEKNHPQLSVRLQSELLAVNRNRLKSERAIEPTELSGADAQFTRRMVEIYLRLPGFGARRVSLWLMRVGYPVSRRRSCRLLEGLGLEAIYRKPLTSVPRLGAQKYPYLFRERLVAMADEVWCEDITYIPMRRGFAYLEAVMDCARQRCCPGSGPTLWK